MFFEDVNKIAMGSNDDIDIQLNTIKHMHIEQMNNIQKSRS